MACEQESHCCRIYWNYIQNKPGNYMGELCFITSRCPWWRGDRRILNSRTGYIGLERDTYKESSEILDK